MLPFNNRSFTRTLLIFLVALLVAVFCGLKYRAVVTAKEGISNSIISLSSDVASAIMTKTKSASFFAAQQTTGCSSPSFQDATYYNTPGTDLVRIVTGDFNGDTSPDLAVATGSANSISVRLNNGKGEYGAEIFVGVGSYAHKVATGDFNGDGRADLAIAAGAGIGISLSNPNGGFAPMVLYRVGNTPVFVAVGDFNGDGKADLASSNYFSDDISVLLGNGNGTFSQAISTAVGDTPLGLAIGDFNGDSKADLVVANSLSDNISMLLGDGKGNFPSRQNIAVTSKPDNVAVGDFNKDNKLDFAVTNAFAGQIDVLLGDGLGGVSTKTILKFGVSLRGIVTTDFNSDGAIDLLVADYSLNLVWLLIGDAKGAFTPTVGYSSARDTYTVAVDDLNKDNKPDIIVGGRNRVSVALGLARGGVTAKANYSGNAPRGVAIGDFNRDGKLDFAVANETANDISLFLGNGTGEFDKPASVNVGAGQYAIVARDFNADGNLDLAVCSIGSDSVLVRLGDGQGSFGALQTYKVGNAPTYITAGDVTGDGKIDLITSNGDSNSLSILPGNGTGGFGQPISLLVGRNPHGVAAGDFNGDGKADLAATSDTPGNEITVYLSNGTGGFTGPTKFVSQTNPHEIIAVDLNADSKTDLAVTNWDSGTVSVFLGNGDGSFKAPAYYQLASNPHSLVAVDLNGDEKLDLAVTKFESFSLSILLGKGDGTFGTAIDTLAGIRPRGLAVGDFDSNGSADLVVANLSSNNTTVLLNACTAFKNTSPRITVATLSREQGAMGAVFSIAAVSDDESLAGGLIVTANPPAGISITDIKNTNGNVTAKVAADCAAKLGDNQVVLTMSDSRATATANLIVNVTENKPPSAGAYADTFIAKVGETTVITPTIKPTDNGSIKSITATAQNFTGTFSANPTTGNITVTNPGPMGEYTVNVTVEDNCGAKAITQFKLNVAFAPDLQVTLQKPPIDIVTDTNFSLSWTLKNGGNQRAGTPFVDRVVLSSQPIPQVFNVLADFPFTQPLDPSQSVTRTQIINIPRSKVVADGNYYLIVMTDADNAIKEGAGENNNFHAVPVKIRRSLLPDLVVVPNSITAPKPPDNARFDQEIIVSWKVKNMGNGATNSAGWNDWVHLSSDDIPELEDPFRIAIQNPTYLAPGEEYASSATIRIPRGLVGTYKVVVYADGGPFFDDNRAWNLIEENEKNNRNSASFQIEIPILPDLQVTAVTAPEETRTGDKMFVSWRIENKGTGNTPPDQMVWEDLIYLSKDTKFDPAEDRLVGSRKHEAGLNNNNNNSYTVVSHVVEVPGNIAGDYYVFVFADGNNTLYEFDKENNNVAYDNRRTVRILATPLDLTAEWITVPTDSAAARQINVKWKVTNLGPNPSKVNWVDTIYLSPDDTPDPKTDKALGSVAYNSILEPTRNYEANANVSLTACITGRYYLYVYTDSGNNEFEFNRDYDAEANNFSKLQPVQITALPPDLQITSLTNDATGNASQPFNLSYTVTNTGIGATVETQWNDNVYLSPTQTFDEKTALLAGTISRIGDVLSNNSYIRSTSVTIPLRAQGDYFVFLKTDADNRVEECGGETNNLTLSPVKINVRNNLPDFTVTSIQPVGNLLSGQMVTLNWTVSNAGTTNALNQSWSDAVFFSPTNSLNGATRLATVNKTGPLNIGASYPNQAKVTIPVIAAPGTYYLIVQADSSDAVFEGQREDNNTNFIALPITIPPTDLAVTSVDAQDQGFSGQFINVKWTVMNNGTQAPYVSSWTDYVYLSADQIFDPATDLSIGHLPHNGALAAGAKYDTNLDVRIPPGLTGPFLSSCKRIATVRSPTTI